MPRGSMPNRFIAISEEAPQSIRNLVDGASTRMQVWKRPSLPKASPLPRNRTLTSPTGLLLGRPVTKEGPTPPSGRPRCEPFGVEGPDLTRRQRLGLRLDGSLERVRQSCVAQRDIDDREKVDGSRGWLRVEHRARGGDRMAKPHRGHDPG